MKSTPQRLKNVTGQLNGVINMIEGEEDVFKVLTQMKAARSALNSAMTKYINEHFWEFINDCSDKEDSWRKFLEELLNS